MNKLPLFSFSLIFKTKKCRVALDILSYFEASPDAREVLVFKGRKHISVKRNLAMSKQVLTIFRRLYEK